MNIFKMMIKSISSFSAKEIFIGTIKSIYTSKGKSPFGLPNKFKNYYRLFLLFVVSIIYFVTTNIIEFIMFSSPLVLLCSFIYFVMKKIKG